jgi:ribosomal protein L16 Arg81 hydroxylase
MSKGVHDIVSLVINFLRIYWQSKHIAIKLFKTTNISRQFLTQNLIELLKKYNVKNQIIFYVKQDLT